jgi:hypothetical protein
LVTIAASGSGTSKKRKASTKEGSAPKEAKKRRVVDSLRFNDATYIDDAGKKHVSHCTLCLVEKDKQVFDSYVADATESVMDTLVCKGTSGGLNDLKRMSNFMMHNKAILQGKMSDLIHKIEHAGFATLVMTELYKPDSKPAPRRNQQTISGSFHIVSKELVDGVMEIKLSLNAPEAA